MHRSIARLAVASMGGLLSVLAQPALAQEGMIYTAVASGGTTSQTVMIHLNGGWQTLFVKPQCVSAICNSRISGLAVVEDRNRVYYASFDHLFYWDADTNTHSAVTNGVSAIFLPYWYRALTYNPDTGMLYGISSTGNSIENVDEIDLDTVQVSTLMTVDVSVHRFNTLDYNRDDNTFYAYDSLFQSEGTYSIDILGDGLITQITGSPFGGAGVGSVTNGDEVYVARPANNVFPYKIGSLSAGGAPWTDFSPAPGPSGTEHSTAFAYWLFPPAPTCCIGNAAKEPSGQVDFGDVTAVLGNWLQVDESGNGTGDANCDGIVDFGDVTEVLGNWLALCP